MTHGSLTLQLHGSVRSGTTYRVRIALHLKRLTFGYVPVNLRAGEHRQEKYRALSSQGLVPALTYGSITLAQSPAILEWLEERWPSPALLPSDQEARGIVRAMCAVIGCDTHPLNNLRVLNLLRRDFGASEAAVDHWAATWIGQAFAALERMIEAHGGTFAFGDEPGMVECYLVPQVFSARRFNADLSPYPKLMAVAERAGLVTEIAAAHPERQPDFVH